MDSRQDIEVPEVGMGVTYHIGSDSYPGTITKVARSGKVFWFRRDKFFATKNTNMMSESQSFLYSKNDKAPEERAYLNKSGVWRLSKGSGCFTVGVKRAYVDPSF